MQIFRDFTNPSTKNPRTVERCNYFSSLQLHLMIAGQDRVLTHDGVTAALMQTVGSQIKRSFGISTTTTLLFTGVDVV